MEERIKKVNNDDIVASEKNKKKIKILMRRLKNFSSYEVNNCKKYFINSKGVNLLSTGCSKISSGGI